MGDNSTLIIVSVMAQLKRGVEKKHYCFNEYQADLPKELKGPFTKFSKRTSSRLQLDYNLNLPLNMQGKQVVKF